MLGAAALAACWRDDATTSPFDFATTRAFVVGEAAAALGQDGRFRFPASVTQPANEVSQADAARHAVTYVRRLGPSHVARWERELGRRIDLAGLSVCDRAFYSRGAYSMPVDAPTEIRRQLGNRWIVSLCDRHGAPTVALSFSPEATELGTGAEAGLQALSEAYFHSAGIPSRVHGPVPISPEDAVAEAVRFARLRVAQVPELVRPAHPASDLLSRWRTSLEAEVQIVARDATAAPARFTDEVFVGFVESFGAIGVLGATSATQVAPLVLLDDGGREWTLQPATPRLAWVRRGDTP